MCRRIFIASQLNPASVPSLFFFTPLLRACSEYYPPAAKKPLLKPFLSVPPSLLILAKLNLQHHVVASRQPLPSTVYPERLGSLQ